MSVLFADLLIEGRFFVTVYLDMEDFEIQNLMNDLFEIGQNDSKCLVQKVSFGFGEDLQGENDGRTPLYLTRKATEEIEAVDSGKSIKGVSFVLFMTNNYSTPDSRFRTPLASGRFKGDLCQISLFKSVPRAFFPAEGRNDELPESEVIEGYSRVIDWLNSIKICLIETR
jgi:hypothetical protein